MKKILIAHISNTLNYGSAMMAINLIAGLRERGGQQFEIYCDCDLYHLNRLKEATGDKTLQSFLVEKPDSNRPKLRKIYELLAGKSNFVKQISSQFDLMVVLGGDDLSETYMKGAMLRGLAYRHINKSCKVVLAGQSLGPFTGIYMLLARQIFHDIMVITRDDNSFEFCVKKLKLPSVHQSRDLAIYPLPLQEKWDRFFDTLDLDVDGYVVVVPSGLVTKYTNDRTGYIETWKEVVRLILRRNNQIKLVLLAHVLAPAGSTDVPVIEDLFAQFSDKEKERLVICKVPIQPAEARALLGKSKFVVTGRMHAAVSTLFAGKPSISLAYSEKYMGVIGRGFDLPELIIDCREHRWGKNSYLIEKISNIINKIEDDPEALIEKIKKKVVECQGMVNKQIDIIYKNID